MEQSQCHVNRQRRGRRRLLVRIRWRQSDAFYSSVTFWYLVLWITRLPCDVFLSRMTLNLWHSLNRWTFNILIWAWRCVVTHCFIVTLCHERHILTWHRKSGFRSDKNLRSITDYSIFLFNEKRLKSTPFPLWWLVHFQILRLNIVSGCQWISSKWISSRIVTNTNRIRCFTLSWIRLQKNRST